MTHHYRACLKAYQAGALATYSPVAHEAPPAAPRVVEPDLRYTHIQHTAMEIEQIETFLAVITVGSVHGASKILRVTQPAVTARIKTRETSLGVRLFERDRDGLRLSMAGRALRPHAEALVQIVARARQTVLRLTPATGGVLQVAARGAGRERCDLAEDAYRNRR